MTTLREQILADMEVFLPTDADADDAANINPWWVGASYTVKDGGPTYITRVVRDPVFDEDQGNFTDSEMTIMARSGGTWGIPRPTPGDVFTFDARNFRVTSVIEDEDVNAYEIVVQKGLVGH